jgi:hypothetical protein
MERPPAKPVGRTQKAAVRAARSANHHADDPPPAPAPTGEAQTPARVQPQAPAPAAAPATAPAAVPAAGPVIGLSQAGKIFGAVIAPTTLLSALLYYFGWAHAFYFFNYFGVNSTVLRFSTTDYLMRSVDALFNPLAATAIAVLLAIVLHGVLRIALDRVSTTMARNIVLAFMAAALALVVLCGFTIFQTTAAIVPLGFAIGVLLVTYAANALRHVWRRSSGSAVLELGPWLTAAAWSGMFVLIGLSLFAAATDYAAAVGRARAHDLAVTLAQEPDVMIYSQKDLSLSAPGIRRLRCRDPQAAYQFRYDGLKLVLESGDLYLFLPENWTPADGTAILLPQSDSVRLEFHAAQAYAPTQGNSC